MTFFFAEIPAKAWLYNQLKFNNKAECFSPVKWNVVVQNIKFSIKIYSNHWNRRRKGHGRTECEGGKERVRAVATWESFQFILDVVSRIPHFCCKWNSVKPGSFTSWRSVRTFSLALINLGILVSNLKFLVWVSDSSEPQSNPRQAWGFFFCLMNILSCRMFSVTCFRTEAVILKAQKLHLGWVLSAGWKVYVLQIFLWMHWKETWNLSGFMWFAINISSCCT